MKFGPPGGPGPGPGPQGDDGGDGDDDGGGRIPRPPRSPRLITPRDSICGHTPHSDIDLTKRIRHAYQTKEVLKRYPIHFKARKAIGIIVCFAS